MGPSRINVATPLVEGMVVSRRILGPLVRQTALNMAKRRRLDHESYQLPHVRRKLKIQELASRYRAELKASEFYTALFSLRNQNQIVSLFLFTFFFLIPKHSDATPIYLTSIFFNPIYSIYSFHVMKSLPPASYTLPKHYYSK